MIKKHLIASLLALFLFLALNPGAVGQNQVFSEQISSNTVTSFAEDPLGYIWIGTNHGLNKFNGSNYISYYTSQREAGLMNDNFYSLGLCSDGNLWFTNECGLGVMEGNGFRQTANSGYNPIYRFLDFDDESILVSDRLGLALISKGTLSKTRQLEDSRCSLSRNLARGEDGGIWIFSKYQDEILKVDSLLNIQLLIPLPRPMAVTAFVLDRGGILWLGGETGNLLCLDTRSNEIIGVPKEISLFAAGHKILFVTCGDDGVVYIGVQGRGILAYNSESGKTGQYHPEEQLSEDSYVAFVDSRGNLWLSDQFSDVRLFVESSVYESLTAMQNEMIDANLKNLTIDRYGQLWARSTSDLICCDRKSGNVIQHYTGRFYSFLFLDSQGRLWSVEDHEIVYCFEPLPGGKLRLLKRYDSFGDVFSVGEDESGYIYLALSDRLARMDDAGQVRYIYPPSNDAFSWFITQIPAHKMFLYTHNDGIFEYGDNNRFTPISSAVNNPVCVYLDDRNSYWIGSFNEGLSRYDANSGELKDFSDGTDDYLPPTINSLIQDRDGNMWVSSSNAIFRIERQTESIALVQDPHFRRGRMYNINCACLDEEGNLYFGGTGGITVIHPELYKKDNLAISLNLDALLVNSEDENVPEDKNIRLDYRHNSIALWYSGVDYTNGSYLNYSYKLDGYDTRWIGAGISKRALYTNLPAGKYRFLARAKVPGGEWSEPQALMQFTIEPAPWNTWEARCLYIVILAALLFAVGKEVISSRIKEEKFRLARKGEELRQNQIDLLTNISHEYRTPLTLVYGPLMQLIHAGDLNEKDAELLQMMKLNIERIKSLTEKILSVDALHSDGLDKEELRVSEIDLDKLLSHIADNFRFFAHERGITVEFFNKGYATGSDWVDVNVVTSIMSNLLSNAVKYAMPPIPDEKGVITIIHDMTQEGKSVITVEDNGPGIPEDKEDEIFMRHRRFAKESEAEGSGIGLNYTRHLANLHGGTINYKKASPHGAVFILEIPTAKDVYPPEQRIDSASQVPEGERTLMRTDENTLHDPVDGRSTVLVAEDNAEVRQYIAKLLSEKYNVVTAHDGRHALEVVSMVMPDILVSDIVMPHMDGFALCRTIKESPQLGHLPVVLLTAKSDLANNIRGLDCGADSYVSKPFDPEYLETVISSLLENRKRIQQALTKLTPSSQDEDVEKVFSALSESDRKLLESVHEQIDARLGDENFSARDLAESVNMSYGNLYARLKALTGQTPQNFIITYRMNRAMELLKAHDKAVKEIAYDVGFSSVQYFSRSFRKHFGYPPSEV